MSEIEITQADRDAAANLAYDLPGSFGGNDEQAIRNGLWDDGELGPIVQAFARHRHEARAEALEEAAKAIEGDGVVIPLATAFVPLIIGHNQPCMSGDMRDRLTPPQAPSVR